MDQSEKLLELKKMLDQKLIDEKEFIRLKQEILNNVGSKSINQNPNQFNNTIADNRQESIPKKTKYILIFSVVFFLVGAIAYFLNMNSSVTVTEVNKDTIAATPIILDSYVFQRKENYPVPKRVMYPLPSTSENIIQSEFYPIGWSSDGRFAYLLIDFIDGKGCSVANVIIQDMTTDQILFTKNSEDYCDVSNPTITTVWNDMSIGLTSVLNQYKIEPLNGTQLLNLPYVYNGNMYDFHLYSRTGLDGNGMTIAEASVISLKVNGNLGKKVYGKTYGSAGPLFNKVVGYLKSPFENRITILFASEFRGYEGPPNEVHLELIGCRID